MDGPSARGDLHRTDGTISAFQLDEVSDYQSTAEPLLPVSEASVVQLRPGPAPTNLVLFSSEKVGVLGLQHHVASVGVIITKPDWFSFMWWDGREDCRINGEPARSTVLYAQGTHDGFYATGGARRTMGIAVRRNDLIETVAALRGIDPEDALLDRTALELSAEASARFRAGLDVLLRSAIQPGPWGVSSASTADPSEAIFGRLVDAYLHSPLKRLREYRARPPEQIVRRAEERYFASQGSPVSLADLCAAAGVSQSALYRAFRTVCDGPPLAYFHKRRLLDARRALIKAPAYRGGVKRAAIVAGLTELGRFSVEYRRLFGESPSATLRRNTHL